MTKYTQQELEQMSDAELDFEVLCAIHGQQLKQWTLSANSECLYHCGPTGGDYCEVKLITHHNSWARMGPLISDSGVDLISPESNGTEDWQAKKFHWDKAEDVAAFHKNPLRAAAIVYILIKQEEDA